MATMLVYIFTDAALDAPTLDRMLRERGRRHASTCSRWTPTRARRTPARSSPTGSPARWTSDAFRDALRAGCIRMTEMLARDGEGAEHLLRVTVRGAADDAEARRVAKSIVNSPLIKTMVYGADPNVGRILMAVGKCFDCTIEPASRPTRGSTASRSCAGGARLDVRRRGRARGARREVVDIEVALGVGDGAATRLRLRPHAGLRRRERGVLLELMLPAGPTRRSSPAAEKRRGSDMIPQIGSINPRDHSLPRRFCAIRGAMLDGRPRRHRVTWSCPANTPPLSALHRTTENTESTEKSWRRDVWALLAVFFSVLSVFSVVHALCR